MANIKSQMKRNRQNAVRNERNKSIRSEMKTRIKQAVTAAGEGAEDIDEQFRRAQASIDTAVAKGVLHKNTAARKKARLARQIADLG